MHVVYNIRTALSQFFLANVQLEAVRGVNSIDSNRSRREIIKHLSPSIKKEIPVKAGNSKKKPTRKVEGRVSTSVVDKKKAFTTLAAHKKKDSYPKPAAGVFDVVLVFYSKNHWR